MDIRAFILNRIKNRGEVRSADVVKTSEFSRTYVNRFLNELKREGTIALIGKANRAKYVSAKGRRPEMLRISTTNVRKTLRNKELMEDTVLKNIKSQTGIFYHLPKSISEILDYGFTEILNNAIEHSRSKKIEVSMERTPSSIQFAVLDRGMGIFKNIMRKKRLRNEQEAIQDLLKGKQTTAPETHSGEGIFFTSKVADTLIIKSSAKKLIFDNLIKDVFIEDNRVVRGTRVYFTIRTRAKTKLNSVFKEYSSKAFAFDKTKVVVKLYKLGTKHISRSEARRIVSGLDKFKTVYLDFQGVSTIGQAFADEVFRVWQRHHPHIKILFQNANKNITFMIRRALVK